MKIINANTLEAKEEILGLLKKSNPNDSQAILNEWLTLSLGTEVFGVWLAVNKDKVVGFCVCELQIEDVPIVFVPYVWISDNSAYKLLIEKIENWTKEKEAVKIKLLTNRSFKTLTNKYGYVFVQAALTKEL